MEALIYALPGWLLFLILVGGSAVLAWVVTWLIRSRIKEPVDHTHNEVIGGVFLVVGALYAVLMAFLIITVWDQYHASERDARNESIKLVALARTTSSFPEPARHEIQDLLRQYINIVINEEWKPTYLLTSGGLSGGSTHARATLAQIWTIYRSLPPSAVDADTTRVLNDFGEARALRLLSMNEEALSGEIWILLLIGAVITIACCMLLYMKNIKLHATLTLFLTGLIAASLWLIIEINNPLAGDLRISPYALNIARQVIDGLPR